MEFIKRLSNFAGPERRTLIGSIVAGLVFSASGLVPPLLVRQILIWHADGTTSGTSIGLIVVALIAAYAVRALARYAYGMLSHWAAYNVQHRMMVTLSRHIQTGAAYSLTEAEAGAVSFYKGLIRTVRVTPRALAPAEFLQPAGASL